MQRPGSLYSSRTGMSCWSVWFRLVCNNTLATEEGMGEDEMRWP